MKTYVGIVRDHSGSMLGLNTYAIEDFNTNLQQIKDNENSKHQNIVSVVECGIRNNNITSKYYRTFVNPKEQLVPVKEVPPLGFYRASCQYSNLICHTVSHTLFSRQCEMFVCQTLLQFRNLGNVS